MTGKGKPCLRRGRVRWSPTLLAQGSARKEGDRRGGPQDVCVCYPVCRVRTPVTASLVSILAKSNRILYSIEKIVSNSVTSFYVDR